MLDKVEHRIKLVEEHIQAENAHDLARIMTTFGEQPRYDDQPWNKHHAGRERVRSYYTVVLAALPDLSIHVNRRHVTHDDIIGKLNVRLAANVFDRQDISEEERNSEITNRFTITSLLRTRTRFFSRHDLARLEAFHQPFLCDRGVDRTKEGSL